MAAPGSASTSAAPLLLLLLLLLSLLFLLYLGAAARPFNTLFVSYAVSSSSYGIASSSRSDVAAAGEQVPSTFFTVYRVRPLGYYSYRSYSSSLAGTSLETLVTTLRPPVGDKRPFLPRPVVREELPFVSSSIHDRARDVLVVVAGLLFGVGCGGLASVAMYLTCALINGRHGVRGSHGYGLVGDGDGDGGVETPQNMGYTDLPVAPATPVALLKEGYSGKSVGTSI